MLVTAALVEPLSETVLPPLPGEEHVRPNDWELYGEGRLEGRAPPHAPQDDAAWFQRHGFHLLHGPVAWATHEQGPAHSTATFEHPPADGASTTSAPTAQPQN